jgi:hypothetical protein
MLRYLYEDMPISNRRDGAKSTAPTQDELDLIRWEGEGGRTNSIEPDRRIKMTNDFDNELRTLRCKYNLTQKLLSYLLGGHPSHTQISRYECGENLPEHCSDVEAIADAIGCTPAERERLIAAYAHSKASTNGTADYVLAARKDTHHE